MSRILFLLIGLTLIGSSTLSAQQPDLESADETRKSNMHAMAVTAKAFRVAVEKIKPALVTIESYGGAGTQRGRIGGIRKQGEGNTTGVMISPDGYVVTSTFNFIQQPPFFSVIPSDGKRRFARMIGRDDTRKICLLKIDGVDDMPVPEMVPVAEIAPGQWALSLGVGYGDQTPALSVGIISAKNRIGGRAIQTDANISPANYGGPLIDIQGRMLGVCVPMNPQSQAIGAGVEWYDSGIGFAIPLAGAEELVARLKKGEKISPAFLGVRVVPNPDGEGLLINKVVPDSPAETAKLKQGDAIVAIDGKDVNDILTLRQVLNRFESGQKIQLVVVKQGKKVEHEVGLTLGVAPKPKGEPDPLEPPEIR